MLYVLNLYRVVCQLYLRKPGRKTNWGNAREGSSDCLLEWEQNRQIDEIGTFLSASGFLQGLETELDGYLLQEERGQRSPLACKQAFLHHLVYAVEKTPDSWPTVTSVWCREPIKLQRPVQPWVYIHFPWAPLLASQSRGGQSGLGIRRTGF